MRKLNRVGLLSPMLCALLLGGLPLSAVEQLHKVDFGIAFAIPVDSEGNPGPGVMLGYRFDLGRQVPGLSAGLRVGFTSNRWTEDSNNTKDTITRYPILAVVRFEKALPNNKDLSFYGDLGLGIAINKVRGELTDAADLTIKESFVLHVEAGGLFRVHNNVQVGLGLFYQYSETDIEIGINNSTSHANLSAWGATLVSAFGF